MSRRWLALLVAFALLLLTVLAWRTLRAPLVPAVALEHAPLVRTLQFSARVATLSRVELGSTLTGRVAEVLVGEGARVRRGEPLLRLESDELRAALEQARAAERQAEARLAGLRGSGRDAAQAGVAQADAVRVAAETELRRTAELVQQGFLSRSRLDDAQRALDVAQAQLAAARAQRSANAEQGSDLVQAQAQLTLARAASTAAQARLEQTQILAPADARVLDRLVEPGQIVQPGRALLALALDGPLQLVAQVDERYLEQLQVGQAASVVADAFPGQRFAARLLSIAPLVDAQRGAIEVKFDPTPAPPFLREDMTLSIEVTTARRERALVLPVDALRDAAADADAAQVLVVRDGRVEARRVKLGLRTLQAAEVLDGLAAGEQVLLGVAPAPGERVRAEPVAAAQALRGAARQPGRDGDAGAALTNAIGR
jgi:HlyD family secretion protein